MRSSSVFLFAALLAVSVVLPSSSYARRLLHDDDWVPRDPKDPYVVEIGNFAVSANNEKTKHAYPLVFISVVKAETLPLDDGLEFRLGVETKHNGVGASEFYQATVIDKPSEKSRVLTAFLKI